uniref:site-specific integrase n=1 Tax=Enterocloster clostridioformis TaxID=1531 RepID=UPI002675EDB0|nr:site-specific integrase [Enterocloster clostridioformis]
MAGKKRTDSKGRVLKTGESQRKDGRYQYQYMDVTGKRRCVYSWDLSDLRQQEKKIQRDIEDGIRNFDSKTMTLNRLFYEYMDNNRHIKKATEVNYRAAWKKHIGDSPIGNKDIGEIRTSDIVRVYNQLIEKGLSTSTVGHMINAVMSPCFEMAVDDDLIRKNPCRGVMSKVKDTENEKKKALTIEEQQSFLAFIEKEPCYKRYLPLFTVLLGTGMRIGECTGLTWSDVDFKNNIIHVTHSLQYRDLGGGREFYIDAPKTQNGVRDIPMITEVRQQLLRQKEYTAFMNRDKEYSISGYSNFVFLSRTGRVFLPCNINATIERIRKLHNEREEAAARKERRSPVILPHMTAHTMRHTFCTRLCENESNVKAIQRIMGHGNIGVTMNVYNHVTTETVREGMKNLDGKIKIS